MMWELIRQNKRKSIVLFIVMGIILLALGYVVGAAWMPPDGGFIGRFGFSFGDRSPAQLDFWPDAGGDIRMDVPAADRRTDIIRRVGRLALTGKAVL